MAANIRMRASKALVNNGSRSMKKFCTVRDNELTPWSIRACSLPVALSPELKKAILKVSNFSMTLCDRSRLT